MPLESMSSKSEKYAAGIPDESKTKIRREITDGPKIWAGSRFPSALVPQGFRPVTFILQKPNSGICLF